MRGAFRLKETYYERISSMNLRLFVIISICGWVLSSCCGKIEEDARDLKSRHQKCAAGDTCVFVTVGDDTCLSPFGCAASINQNGADKYKKEARELEKDYDHCSSCSMASCEGTAGLEAYCNTATGKCDSRTTEE